MLSNFELITLCKEDCGFYEIESLNRDTMEDMGTNWDYVYEKHMNVKCLDELKEREIYDISFINERGEHKLHTHLLKRDVLNFYNNTVDYMQDYINIFNIKNRINFKEWLHEQNI